MTNELTEKRIVEALEKQMGKPPRKMELGGGYYYKCYWEACNEDLNMFMNYCPHCGTRVIWNDE